MMVGASVLVLIVLVLNTTLLILLRGGEGLCSSVFDFMCAYDNVRKNYPFTVSHLELVTIYTVISCNPSNDAMDLKNTRFLTSYPPIYCRVDI